jgi:hypothetical protein
MLTTNNSKRNSLVKTINKSSSHCQKILVIFFLKYLVVPSSVQEMFRMLIFGRDEEKLP